MNNLKTTCFRFNLDNPEHANAWNYLKQLDKSVFKSCNEAVIKAVNDYFERYFRSIDDPYFETRQREEQFVTQIVSEVGKALASEMPRFLASFMISLKADYPVNISTSTASETSEINSENDYSDIDFDFIGG